MRRAVLAAFTGPAPVDYLLVNIETGWHELLRHGQWTANVHCIKIEIQDHYDEVVPLLEALGYQAQLLRLELGRLCHRHPPRRSGYRPRLTANPGPSTPPLRTSSG